jgi:hypothetical protein
MRTAIHFKGQVIWVAALLAIFMFSGVANAATADEKCANNINKGASKVAKAYAKDAAACIKNAGKGKTEKLGPGGTASTCLTADVKGKVAKAVSKIKTGDCGGSAPAAIPGLVIVPADIKDIMRDKDLQLVEAIFGDDLDAVIVNAKDPNAGAAAKAESKCQAAVIKAVGKCQDAKLSSFNACKKDLLKGGDPNGPPPSLQDDCMGANGTTDGIDDTKGKILKKCADFDLAKKCASVDKDALFPGAAPVSAASIDAAVECEVCKALNLLDGLARSCDEFDDGVINQSCYYPGVDSIGHHTCVFDTDSFCVGDDPNGRPYVDQTCTDPIEHSDCPPGPNLGDPNKSTRCIGNTGVWMDTVDLSPLFTIAMVGDIELDCGAIDPNTHKAVCRCDVGLIDPIDLPGIGYVCMDSIPDCPAGELDCAGGTALDMDLVNEHDAGEVVWGEDPNWWIVPKCNWPDPNTGNPRCGEMCDVYCPSLGGDFTTFRSGCEGFCRGGSLDGKKCDLDPDCVDADCLGADPLTHRGACGCHCLELGGEPSRAGALTCQLGLSVVLEAGEPCGEGEVTVRIPGQCVPMTTEYFTQTILHANRQLLQQIGPDTIRGQPVECSDLVAGKLGGLTLVGNSTSYDTQVGDLSVPIRIVCVDEE